MIDHRTMAMEDITVAVGDIIEATGEETVPHLHSGEAIGVAGAVAVVDIACGFSTLLF